MNSELFLGLDVGTQGARALVVDRTGKVAAQAARSFSDVEVPGLPAGMAEQRPESWWEVCVSVLRQTVADLGSAVQIRAIAVDSTSGTVLPIDADGNPLRPALMYNDGRAVEEAGMVNEAASDFTDKLGYKFGASFALPKILWLKRHEPETFDRTWKFVHAADFIVGKLTGKFGVSDSSNALKAGYDLADLRWPDFIEEDDLLPLDKLPRVVRPGEQIAVIGERCAAETGLPAGTPVVGGVSDGTAGFIASGAAKPGEWNVTLGTTLVARGVSKRLVKDPVGRIYCHRHPDGYWLPGGASNVGGECLEKAFAGEHDRKK